MGLRVGDEVTYRGEIKIFHGRRAELIAFHNDGIVLLRFDGSIVFRTVVGVVTDRINAAFEEHGEGRSG